MDMRNDPPGGPDGGNEDFSLSESNLPRYSGKWYGFFCPPHFEKLDVINRFGNILYGLNGSAATMHLASAASLTASLGATLPFFGIVAGVIDLLNYGQQYWNDKYEGKGKVATSLFTLRTLSSLFLTGAGIKEAAHFHTFALGMPGCGLLFTAFLIKASLDFLWALSIYLYYKNLISQAKKNSDTDIDIPKWVDGKMNSESISIADAEKTASKNFIELITKTLSLTGWIFLTAGHPLGWVFLAATALTCGYQIYSDCQGNKQLNIDSDPAMRNSSVQVPPLLHDEEDDVAATKRGSAKHKATAATTYKKRKESSEILLDDSTQTPNFDAVARQGTGAFL
ncbi:MAG: hypothetical protein K0R24_193 [Gammaproteobacteria bacterium]|nr:hypothetical protein [Gammaproteobacteria bacterium]